MATKAKAKTGTDVAVVKPGANAVAVDVPDFLKGFTGRTGAEGIDSNDITMPRIKLGQSMTPQVKDGDFKEGVLFLNVSDEVLAEPGKPLPVVILAQSKEYILWRPRKDNGGGILARAKPVLVHGEKKYAWDKPNQDFKVKVEGKIDVTWHTKNYIEEDGLAEFGSEIPGNKDSGIAATAHHNYIVALPTFGNDFAAFSLSKSQVKKAKDLNALLKRQAQAKGIPIYSLLFNAQTWDDKSDQGPFKNIEFKNAGYVTEADFRYYEGVAKSFEGKAINVDQSDGGDDEGGDKRL